MGKMGRPPYEPTNEERAKVAALSAHGIPIPMICKYIGVGSKNTLKKYFSDELVKGKVDALTEVAGALFKNAVYENNVTAQIFIMKTQGRWSVEHDTSHTIDDDDDDGTVDKIELEILPPKVNNNDN